MVETMFHPMKTSTRVYFHVCGCRSLSVSRPPGWWSPTDCVEASVPGRQRESAPSWEQNWGPPVGFLILALSPKCKWSGRPLGREQGSHGRMSGPAATLLEPGSDSSRGHSGRRASSSTSTSCSAVFFTFLVVNSNFYQLQLGGSTCGWLTRSMKMFFTQNSPLSSIQRH